MHLILTGATGLVGSACLHNMLMQEGIQRISILSRRPVEMAEGHDKVKVIIHKDFKNYDSALLEELKDAHGCVWALGVSQNAVNQTFVALSSLPYNRELTQIQTIRRDYTGLSHCRRKSIFDTSPRLPLHIRFRVG